MEKIFWFLIAILAIFILFSIAPFILMLIWNYVIAQLFAVSLVSFWQMFWISIALWIIGGFFKNSSN